MSSIASSHKPLTGGTAVWIFMAVEAVTFGMFLLYFAASWRGQETVFAESQALLHPTSATFGTVLLLLGSWAAYQGVLDCEAGRGKAAAGWFAGTTLSGVLFSVNKINEYADLDGITLSTNAFWFSYQFLTGLHLLHVLVGIGGFVYLAVRAAQGRIGEGEDLLAMQAGAAYWHLIDVIWLVLFPILYLMHP